MRRLSSMAASVAMLQIIGALYFMSIADKVSGRANSNAPATLFIAE